MAQENNIGVMFNEPNPTLKKNYKCNCCEKRKVILFDYKKEICYQCITSVPKHIAPIQRNRYLMARKEKRRKYGNKL